VQVEEFQKGDAAPVTTAAVPAGDAAAAAAAATAPTAPVTSILAPSEPLKAPEDEQYTVHVPEGLRMQVRRWFMYRFTPGTVCITLVTILAALPPPELDPKCILSYS